MAAGALTPTHAVHSYLEQLYLREIRRSAFALLPHLPQIRRFLEKEVQRLAPLELESAKEELARVIREFSEEYTGQLEGRLMTATSRANWGDTAKKKIEDRMKEQIEGTACPSPKIG